MRKVFLLSIFIFIACEQQQGQAPRPVSPSYDNFRKTLTGKNKGGFNGIKIVQNLNRLLKGPTVDACDLSFEGSYNPNDISEDEEFSGFPLTIANDDGGSIKGEKQIVWDECKGIKSNYDNGEVRAGCTKRRLSKEYFDFFNENFGTCVQVAAMGFESNADVEKISFSHNGISGDPRHSNRSYHSVNRAIDIKQIKITQNGETKILKVTDQKKSPTKEFFEAFRGCWHNKIKNYKPDCPGSSHKGSIGHEDDDHQHHLHLSLPYCPSNGYFAK